MKENPFFPDLYQKIKLDENEEYVGKHYLQELVPDGQSKKYMFDELWSPVASEEAIMGVAQIVLEMLKDAKLSGRWEGEKEERRVPNTYNDGWHFETVYVTDVTKHKIDF